ncbi:unnamed protein product [Diamesa hyperborea]
MFTAEKISALFNATILLGHYPQFYSFIFNENVKDFQNVPGKFWELREYNMTMIQNDNKTFVAGIPQLYSSDKNYQQELWEAACLALGVKYVTKQLENSNLLKDFHAKNVDVIMLTYGPLRYEMFLNPFAATDYAIFYKAGTFEVSSTYFMDGLTTFTFIVALLSIKKTPILFENLDDFARLRTHTICLPRGPLAYKYFYDSSGQILEKFRGIYNEPVCKSRQFSIEHICKNENVAEVWSLHQVEANRYGCKLIKMSGIFPKQYGSLLIQNDFKYREEFNRIFKAWKVQTMCGWFFNIVMMTATFTFIVALLSIKKTPILFENLDDLARLRTHTICLPRGPLAHKYFYDSSGEILEKFRGIYNEPVCNLKQSSIEHICKNENVAEVWSLHQVEANRYGCKLIKMSGIFPKQYGSLLIQNDFKYREEFNRIISMRKSSNIIVPIEEIEMKDLNQDVQQVDMNRSVPHLTQVDVHEDNTDDLISEFVEYLEIIDLE